jgi:hypothetical protein
MTRLVVDSSVGIKWSMPEVHSEGALRYLDPDLERFAPELLLAEIANILWMKVSRKELTREQAERIVANVPCYSRVSESDWMMSPELHGFTLGITTWGGPPFEDVGDRLTHRLEEPV